MKYIEIGGKKISEIGLGCMRIFNKTPQDVNVLMYSALEAGINFFDHADIYGKGKCEEIFGDALALSPNLRDKVVIQTKCGISNGMYDFSKKHILESVEKSLKKLKTDHIDFLLLHRPDALCEPEEVAETFNLLYDSGKVCAFGVSNHNPMQIELLKKYCSRKICINQLQLSAAYTPMIDEGINVNTMNVGGIVRDGGVLDYCRLNDILIQPWSPFQYGFFQGVFIDNLKFPELNMSLKKIAKKYNITDSAAAIAWILRHPANMQPIIGSTNPQRIKQIAEASKVRITREEWYEVYKAAGNNLP